MKSNYVSRRSSEEGCDIDYSDPNAFWPMETSTTDTHRKQVEYTPVQDTYFPRKSVSEPKRCESQFMWGFIVGVIPSIIYILQNH